MAVVGGLVLETKLDSLMSSRMALRVAVTSFLLTTHSFCKTY